MCKKFDKYLINQELQEIENSKDDVLFSLLMEKILKNYLIFYGSSFYIKNKTEEEKKRLQEIKKRMDKISVRFETYFKNNTEKIQYFHQAISTFCKTIQEYQEELDERFNINS